MYLTLNYKTSLGKSHFFTPRKSISFLFSPSATQSLLKCLTHTHTIGLSVEKILQQVSPAQIIYQDM
jgi:hypothetical protein